MRTHLGDLLLSGGKHLNRSHHFVVFVFEDMAVPDVAAGVSVEGDDDACDHGGVGAYRIFPSHFFGRGGLGGSEEVQRALGLIFKGVERAAVEDLEADQMQVDGVGVVGEVDELPYLRGVEDGLLGDGGVPWGVVEQHAHRVLEHVHALVEGESAGAGGGGLGDALDRV